MGFAAFVDGAGDDGAPDPYAPWWKQLFDRDRAVQAGVFSGVGDAEISSAEYALNPIPAALNDCSGRQLAGIYAACKRLSGSAGSGVQTVQHRRHGTLRSPN